MMNQKNETKSNFTFFRFYVILFKGIDRLCKVVKLSMQLWTNALRFI